MRVVFLIPSELSNGAIDTIPLSVVNAVKQCEVFFVENERTTRRFFKKIWKEMVIDNYEWFAIKDDGTTEAAFSKKLDEGKAIGIVSEAGCPGIADPGQQLVAIAQQKNITVRPLVGPSSILLALMASGMNGQQFRFNGYLPIDARKRIEAIKELENISSKTGSTEIFIETPYRNAQMTETLLKNCSNTTKLCIASDITGLTESIKTMTVAEWKKQPPLLQKIPTIFLINAH